MLMLHFIFNLTRGNTPSDEEIKISKLDPQEKALYEKIVSNLFQWCEEQTHMIHPVLNPKSPEPYCALIFRQSKSWTDVEQMLKETLQRGRVGPITSAWVAKWQKRIENLRKGQKELLDCEAERQKLVKIETLLRRQVTSKAGPINVNAPGSAAYLENRVKTIQSELMTELNLARDEILPSPNHMRLHASIQKIISFLQVHWLQLIVFAEWPEVSLDAETIAFRRRTPKPKTPSSPEPNFSQFLNNATKAIFLIQETAQQKMTLEYKGEEPATLIRPETIGLGEKHLAPASPYMGTKRPPSTIELTDEYIFDVSFSKRDAKTKPSISQTALQLEKLVTLALFTVNKKQLAKDAEKQKPYDFNKWFLDTMWYSSNK